MAATKAEERETFAIIQSFTGQELKAIFKLSWVVLGWPSGGPGVVLR
ncbi:MAG: hypothetical protein ACRDEA_09335 [Microcystaceae cyanobacterium]